MDSFAQLAKVSTKTSKRDLITRLKFLERGRPSFELTLTGLSRAFGAERELPAVVPTISTQDMARVAKEKESGRQSMFDNITDDVFDDPPAIARLPVVKQSRLLS